MVALHNDSSSIQTISNHERIAQLIIEPYRRADFLVVDDLADTERGEGGFGSTGK
jgi:dUTP pyrophosphatase